jgi:riboflavin biosynthesis pyrimidine reductase
MGIRRLFIEGGGVTISHFLQAGCLDHLHVTVAPVILGSGRQGIELAEIQSIDAVLRPVSHVWPMGSDVLFDCHFARRS